MLHDSYIKIKVKGSDERNVGCIGIRVLAVSVEIPTNSYIMLTNYY